MEFQKNVSDNHIGVFFSIGLMHDQQTIWVYLFKESHAYTRMVYGPWNQRYIRILLVSAKLMPWGYLT